MKKLYYVSYISTLILLTIFSYLFVDPNLFYFQKIYSGFFLSHRPVTTILYISFVLALFIEYLFVYILYKQHNFLTKDIINFILLTAVILLFSYPAMLSYDIFNYIATAKITFLYKENPYIIMPVDIPNEPMLKFIHAGNKIALYGPVWIILTFIPLFLGIGNFFLTLLAFKLFSIVGYLGICWTFWKLNKDIKTILIFAFNPLVILELCLSGHNDGIMMFFALLSVYFLKNKKILPSVIMLIASIGIKYATVFLIPVYIFVLLKTIMKRSVNWNKIFFYCLVSMLIIFVLSPLREEMYPWYAVWFLPFVYLSDNKLLLWISYGLSLGLILRYIPFMYLGTYFGPTPLLRVILTAIPVIVSLFIYIINTKFRVQMTNIF